MYIKCNAFFNFHKHSLSEATHAYNCLLKAPAWQRQRPTKEAQTMREAIQVVSVNIGKSAPVNDGEGVYESGIFKHPVLGPVAVTESGLDGDAIVDMKFHGGPDQAVYVYNTEDYEWWAAQMDRDFFPGLFGENLTVSGLPSNLSIGDRLLIGDVVLEATSARIPCNTLAARMGDTGFGMAFRKAERPGVYFRVLNPGLIAADDAVTLIESGDSHVTIVDLFRFGFSKTADAATLRRYLEAPLAERVREQVTAALEAIDSP
jgi:MOSC domain-containing protein YiiM